jgi:hypothetical protein
MTSNRITHGLASLAILVAGACTTAMNWRFSYQLGTTEWDSYTWATFSVALDVTKWLMLPYAALAWKFHKARAVAAMSIWLVATVYSFTAAIGFSALNRDTSAADRRHQTELHKTLTTMKQSPKWQSSAACADATSPQSKKFCASYRETEARLKSVPLEADPQSALFSRLTGLPPDTVRVLLSLFLATACEIISALGFFAILSPSQNKQPESKTVPRWKAPTWGSSKSDVDVARHDTTSRDMSRRGPTWKSPR